MRPRAHAHLTFEHDHCTHTHAVADKRIRVKGRFVKIDPNAPVVAEVEETGAAATVAAAAAAGAAPAGASRRNNKLAVIQEGVATMEPLPPRLPSPPSGDSEQGDGESVDGPEDDDDGEEEEVREVPVRRMRRHSIC